MKTYLFLFLSGLLLLGGEAAAQTPREGATIDHPFELGVLCPFNSNVNIPETFIPDAIPSYGNEYDAALSSRCQNGTASNDIWTRFTLSYQSEVLFSVTDPTNGNRQCRLHLLLETPGASPGFEYLSSFQTNGHNYTLIDTSYTLVGGTYYAVLELVDPSETGYMSLRITTPTVPQELAVVPAVARIYPGESATFSATGGSCDFTWSPALGLDTTAGITVTASPTQNMTYTVTSADGQHAQVRVIIEGVATNFVRTYTPRIEGLRDTAELRNQRVEDCAVELTFLDGLGRTLQQVTPHGSPQRRDLVQPMAYDLMGRAYKQYLPYAADSTDDGYAAFQYSYAQRQASFYLAGQDRVANDPRPWGTTTYENGPLGRELTQSPPGEAWKPGSNHHLRLQYGVNNANEIPLLTCDAAGTVTRAGYYAAGRLTVKATTNENGHTTTTFTDLDGRLIAQRRQFELTNYPANYTTQAATTYYVYDALGRRRLVLQPEGAARMAAANGPLPDTLLQRWAFRYDYDSLGRQTRAYVPGGGNTYSVYNQRDQLLLTGDAAGNWRFHKYDELGRLIATGRYPNGHGRTQAQLQAAANQHRYPTEQTRRDSTGTFAYTLHRSFPTDFDERDLLTRAFFDSYQFAELQDHGHAFTPVEYQPEPDNPDSRSLKLDSANLATRVRGLPTASCERVLGDQTGQWLTTTTWYDPRERPRQTLTDLYGGGSERTSSWLNFPGQVEHVLTHHHYTPAAQPASDHRLYLAHTYDHAGRLTRTDHRIDEQPLLQLAAYQYNELGQLVDKRLHSDDGGYHAAQSVDFRYNIRGWLTHINNRNLSNKVVLEGGVDPNSDHPTRDEPDLFGLELKYNHHTGLDATNPGTPQYNGNIAAALWQTRQGGTPRGLHAYQYFYDAADRLTSANFRSYTFTPDGNGFGTWGWGNAAYDYSVPEIAYDRNGNLRRLSRKGPQPDSLLDKLTFAYRGNRMIAANDEAVGSAPTNDFEDNGVRQPVEYRYDGSGNLTADANKGLDSIAYNHLNLPEFLHWTNGNTLRYVYSAAGRKLLAYADGHDQPDGPPVHRLTAYVGPSGFQYATDANDSLRLLHVPTPEGRLVFLPDRADKNAGFGWQYEYHLKDQVGNLRLAFRTRGRTARDIEDSFEPDQSRSAAASTKPQVEHENETRYRAPLLARTGEHVALVNAREAQHRVGPALTVPVSAGDSVYASVYARVEPPLPRPWWKMALPAPEIAELDGAKNSRRVRFWPRLGLNLAPWLLPQAQRTTTTGQVYMRVQTLNEQQQVLSEEHFYVDPAVSPTQWQYLLAKLAAAQSGYVRVELVNESGDNAYFDDLQVRLVNDLIQENHYDPFGLNLAELEVKGDPDCKYQFNGKEKQEDFGLGWNDHGARNYTPDIPTWWSVDPLANEFPEESPYVFGHNNPVNFNDLDGRSASTHTDAEGNVLAVYNDGDLGVYKHNEAKTKAEIDKNHSNKNTSAGGEKMGKTEFWDEFAAHDLRGNVFERPELGAVIHYGVSRDRYIDDMIDYARRMMIENSDLLLSGADWLKTNSRRHRVLDIKDKLGASSGYLFKGLYTSGESLGNYLFGFNLSSKAAIPHTGFSAESWWDSAMSLAGDYHNSSNKTNNPNVAPYYGEIPYSGRRVAQGYWGKSYNNWKRRYKRAEF